MVEDVDTLTRTADNLYGGFVIRVTFTITAAFQLARGTVLGNP